MLKILQIIVLLGPNGDSYFQYSISKDYILRQLYSDNTLQMNHFLYDVKQEYLYSNISGVQKLAGIQESEGEWIVENEIMIAEHNVTEYYSNLYKDNSVLIMKEFNIPSFDGIPSLQRRYYRYSTSEIIKEYLDDIQYLTSVGIESISIGTEILYLFDYCLNKPYGLSGSKCFKHLSETSEVFVKRDFFEKFITN